MTWSFETDRSICLKLQLSLSYTHVFVLAQQILEHLPMHQLVVINLAEMGIAIRTCHSLAMHQQMLVPNNWHHQVFFAVFLPRTKQLQLLPIPRPPRYLLLPTSNTSIKPLCFSSSISPASLSLSSASNLYLLTVPASLPFSASLNPTRFPFDRNGIGVKRRTRPRIPRDDFSIPSYWRRRVEGSVQSIVVAGT